MSAYQPRDSALSITDRLLIDRRSLNREERQSLQEKKKAVLQSVERMVLKESLSKDLEVISESM